MSDSNNQNRQNTAKNDDTNLQSFFGSLAAGVQEQIIQKVLSKVGKAVLSHGTKGKTGEVNIKLKFARLSDDSIEQGALKITSEVAFASPTQRGKASENEVRESVMYMTSTGLSDVPPRKLDDEVASQQGMPTLNPKTGNFAS